MATFDFKIDPSLFDGLDDPQLCKDMINEALPTLEAAVRRGYEAHHDTGALEKSIKVNPPRPVNGGYYANITLSGDDAKGMSNMAKAIWLEYGTIKQAPDPVMQRAVSTSENKIINKMKLVFDTAAQKRRGGR